MVLIGPCEFLVFPPQIHLSIRLRYMIKRNQRRQVTHVHREANGCAHSLAKLACNLIDELNVPLVLLTGS